MIHYKKSIVFIFIYTATFFLKGNSQNISGDTIFINRNLTYTVVLPTGPTSFSTIPDNTYYKIRPEKKFIIITTDKENLSPAILKISEGGRVHNFTIFYKKKIDFSDPNAGIKDYPTLKILQERVNELALQKSAPEEKKQAVINQSDINKNITTESANIKVLSVKNENQRLNDIYNQYIAEGESAFNKNQLTAARAAYNQVLSIRPNDVIAGKYIKLIEAKEKSQRDGEQLNKNYEASVALADKLFNSGDYDNSRAAYKTALGFIEKDYPEKQINIIDKFIAAGVSKVKADKQKLAKDEKEAKQYATLIENADIEFEKDNLSNARKIYIQASNLRPEEEYPKNKIGIIGEIVNRKVADLKVKKDSIEVANETNKKYNEALKQGKAYSSKNDFLKAKDAYEEAMNLKPLEKEPEKQLQIINSTLADIVRKKETDSNYTSKISIADSLSKVKLYDSALKAYSEAQVLKPAELYPNQQIKAMQFQLARIERINEYNKKVEEERSYNEAIRNANKNYYNKKNYEAKSEFIRAQSILPLNKTDQQRFDNLLYQIDKYQKDSLSKIPVITAPPKKSKRKRFFRKKGRKNNTFKIWLKPLEHGFDLQAGFLSSAPQELKT